MVGAWPNLFRISHVVFEVCMINVDTYIHKNYLKGRKKNIDELLKKTNKCLSPTPPKPCVNPKAQKSKTQGEYKSSLKSK